MAQISLYVDDDVLRQLEEAARGQELSISRYVSNLVKAHFDTSWPPDYFQLFGSIQDDTFMPRSDFDEAVADIPREQLL